MNDDTGQTKQTNTTNALSGVTGRPADVGEDAVIAAGCAIRERGDAVTATGLRREIGKGRPQRLKEIWDTYAAAAEAKRERERADLPDDIRQHVAEAVADLSEKVTDFVTAAYASATQHANAKIERQRCDLEARERAADAEVQAAYKIVEDADAQQADVLNRIRDLEADLRTEREARLTSEKRATESESVLREVRAQLSTSKTENDELRSLLGELRAFKQRVQKQCQNENRLSQSPTANETKKADKTTPARNSAN